MAPQSPPCRYPRGVLDDVPPAPNEDRPLTRAMRLLHAVWDQSAEGTDVIARKVGNGNHWNDVVRWVNEGTAA